MNETELTHMPPSPSYNMHHIPLPAEGVIATTASPSHVLCFLYWGALLRLIRDVLFHP